MTTIHMLAPFHTIVSNEFSHCAFTGKVLRFPKMMKSTGFKIVEYGVEGSESLADEHVVVLTRKRRDKLIGRVSGHIGSKAVLGSPLHTEFSKKLLPLIQRRIRPFDIVAHPFGRSHIELYGLLPQAFHVETGIGYPDGPFGAFRIFESEAWRHFHWGKYDGFDGGHSGNRWFSWAIPNYFDVSEWPLRGSTPTAGFTRVCYMGRLEERKGSKTLAQIREAYDRKYPGNAFTWHAAGIGETVPGWEMVGELRGSERADFLRDARCLLMPTNFIEPFGGSGVEAMMMGVPLIASDFGAFTETVRDGVTGFRCKTLGDFVEAIAQCGELHTGTIRGHARARYSLDVVAPLYVSAFEQILSLGGEGWEDLRPRNVHLKKLENR